jgi:dihydroxyacetone kinase-like predicted kinase
METDLIKKSLEKNIYDVQFSVTTSKDLEKIKEYLSGIGESVDVGYFDLDKNRKLLKVHIHTDHPDKVLRYATAISEFRLNKSKKINDINTNEMVNNIVVENMVDQYHDKTVLEKHTEKEPAYMMVDRKQFKSLYDKLKPMQKKIFFDNYIKPIVKEVSEMDEKDISKVVDRAPIKIDKKDLDNICIKMYEHY